MTKSLSHSPAGAPKAMVSKGALVALLVSVALVALPWYSGFATQRLLVEIFTLFAIALAWNLLAGYGGLVAIGHHAFVGIGAYALFWLTASTQMNPWLLLPAAPLAGALLAGISAAPLFRLSGAHFAVATWVLAELLRIGALNSAWLGAGGGMPLEGIGEFDRSTRNAGVYWAALAVAATALLVARTALRGRLGLALTSVRDAEAAAAASGVPVARAKFALWVIAGAITAAAGAVSFMGTLQVTPDASFGLSWTAAAIFIAVLGGIGTIEGPIVGIVIYFLLRQTFAGYGSWYLIGLGVLAMATMVVAPGGAWSLVPRRWPDFDPFGIRRRAP